jgi:hypothetical protein
LQKFHTENGHSLNDRVGDSLSNAKFGRRSLVDSIQERINKAIEEKKEMKPIEIPKDIPKVKVIKSKVIKPVEFKKYEPKPENKEITPSIFKDKSFRIGTNFLGHKPKNIFPVQK